MNAPGAGTQRPVRADVEITPKPVIQFTSTLQFGYVVLQDIPGLFMLNPGSASGAENTVRIQSFGAGRRLGE